MRFPEDEAGTSALLTVTQEPDPAVTLDLVKKHLRIDGDDEDDQLEIYLRSAIEYVQNATTRVLAPTEFVYRVRIDGRKIDLPRCPVRDVIEVSSIGDDGIATPLSGTDWRFIPTQSGGYVRLNDWQCDVISVAFSAGYDMPDLTGSGDDPAFRRPDLATAAIFLLVGHWFENREAVADVQTYPLPFAVEAILQQLRVYR